MNLFIHTDDAAAVLETAFAGKKNIHIEWHSIECQCERYRLFVALISLFAQFVGACLYVGIEFFECCFQFVRIMADSAVNVILVHLAVRELLLQLLQEFLVLCNHIAAILHYHSVLFQTVSNQYLVYVMLLLSR